MRVFEDIKLEWRGKEYQIPARRVMAAIRRIEAVATIPELVATSPGSNQPRMAMGQLAAAYAEALRCAGANLTDEEVYDGMFPDPGEEMAGLAARYNLALQGILAMMVPPARMGQLNGANGAGSAPAKKSAPVAAAKSSPKRSR